MTANEAAADGAFERKLRGFGPLQEADRRALAAIEAAARTVAPETDLVREGDRPEGMVVILDGFACRYKLRRNGARQIMAYLIPGDSCDLAASLPHRMDHAIGALSACRVAQIAPEAGRDLLRRPAIARALRNAALAEEATLREWLVNIGRRSAVERLAHLFCEMYVRLGAVGLTEGHRYVLPVTQLDLADTTGMTSVHVNRSLGELRRLGLIERKGKRLTILDLPRLMDVAEFQADYLHLAQRAAV